MELLAEQVLAQINQHVYARFPEIKDMQPVQKPAPAGPNVILTYRHKDTTEDGFSIERVVRATVTPEGEIVKMSTSR